eukprot:351612-Chlamydomonas_euryale.AAC.14
MCMTHACSRCIGCVAWSATGSGCNVDSATVRAGVRARARVASSGPVVNGTFTCIPGVWGTPVCIMCMRANVRESAIQGVNPRTRQARAGYHGRCGYISLQQFKAHQGG